MEIVTVCLLPGEVFIHSLVASDVGVGLFVSGVATVAITNQRSHSPPLALDKF